MKGGNEGKNLARAASKTVMASFAAMFGMADASADAPKNIETEQGRSSLGLKDAGEAVKERMELYDKFMEHFFYSEQRITIENIVSARISPNALRDLKDAMHEVSKEAIRSGGDAVALFSNEADFWGAVEKRIGHLSQEDKSAAREVVNLVSDAARKWMPPPGAVQ